MKYKFIRTMFIILLSALLLSCHKKNQPPSTPCSPGGPTIGVVHRLYRFVAASSDPNGDSIALRFDWGDGDTSDWSEFIEPDGAWAMFHSWSILDNYYVKVQAKDQKELTSKWSLPLIVEITKNQLPIVSTPSGPLNGSINTSYQFSCLAIDPNGDDVAIRFDWGDGDTSEWSIPFPSGISVSMTHSWQTFDTFQIKVQAVDKEDLKSEWSLPHSIKIIKDYHYPPKWQRRSSHTSLVFDNKMWVMGGGSNDVWYSSDGATWTCATDSTGWSPRGGHTSVVFDNKMWVMGGRSNDVWYSSDGLTWTCATDSAEWSPRSYHSSVVFDNKIWILGGQGGDHQYNDVWYSSDGVNWICATDSAQWIPRLGHKSVFFDNRIWVLGGYSRGDVLNDVWYSIDGVNWTCTTEAAEWLGRYAHTSVVFDDKLWVIGGGGANISIYNDVWYSSSGTNWVCATPSAEWSPRGYHSSVVFDNKIWVLSGSRYNDVWYSSDGVNWTPAID